MLEFLLSFLLLYKYLALFVITFLASLALPLPSTIVLIATGAFAGQGYFNFYDIIVIGSISTVAGDYASFFITQRWGAHILPKIGFKKLLASQKFITLRENFIQHSFASIFYSRFLITSLGIPINFIAGLSKLTFKKFFIPDLVGELIYVILYAGIGYILGNEWRSISDIFENIAWALLILVVMVVVYLMFAKKKR